MKLPAAEALVGRRILIVGDVNTGKTHATLELARALFSAGWRDMVILDFAPETTRGIGGKMSLDGFENVQYLTAQIIPPRLTGKTREEVEEYARINAQRIEVILEAGLDRPREVAVINDVSLYLQGAEVETLLGWLDYARTVVINGYYGKSFDETEFSMRERARMEALMKCCDEIIRL
ncbi:MAG: hypothetical protein JRI22_16680 [Deltaproteobacteria bacterium]|nr:hypothetical protein [Deltaproteobacteria bacterium]